MQHKKHIFASLKLMFWCLKHLKIISHTSEEESVSYVNVPNEENFYSKWIPEGKEAGKKQSKKQKVQKVEGQRERHPSHKQSWRPDSNLTEF